MKPSFDSEAFQKRINDAIGVASDRPLIKLVWCPSEFRWMPHRLGEDAPGYTFPVFCTGRDADGKLHAPERWGLLQRIEWPQFGPMWEAVRYKRHDGAIWDLKGPCPSEKYTELRLHSHHDGTCCPCMGFECKCDPDCKGNYAAPNEWLFDWIRRSAYEARNDSDVEPFADARFFAAPNAQREVADNHENAWAAHEADVAVLDKEARDLWLKNPHSINFTKSESGLYLPN